MLKIGDKVKIKTLNKLKKEDPDFRSKLPYFMTEMDMYAGEFTKVVNITYNNDIHLDIDDGNYNWHPDWIENLRVISMADELFEL